MSDPADKAKDYRNEYLQPSIRGKLWNKTKETPFVPIGRYSFMFNYYMYVCVLLWDRVTPVGHCALIIIKLSTAQL